MYYRRWTRMHLKPGMKYFMKYGVISPEFDRYSYLMNLQNPDPIQYRTRKIIPNTDRDLDTKLINSLFLKYPDLKYEPISHNTYPGRQLNTFSYAYSFINEQKKLIKQGHSISSAFKITEEKYHEKMQRKLDQSLLSRGLAMSNRARSFMNVYQQQSEYESRLKTQRSQRQLQKYEMKLQAIREAAQSDTGAESILNKEILDHQRIFYEIYENTKDPNYSGPMQEVSHTQISKIDGKERTEFLAKIESKFKNLFDRFYEHAAAKDRLEGLTDDEIISQIQSSPSKIKRRMKDVAKFFQSRNIKVSLVNGKIIVSGQNSHLISDDLKNNKYLKIALLEQSLNYQKPIYSTTENITMNTQSMNKIFKNRAIFKQERPQAYSKEDKDVIKQNKKKELDLVVDQQLFYHKEAYKVFQTQEERLLRLQIKYYDKLIKQIYQNRHRKENVEEKEEQLNSQIANSTTASNIDPKVEKKDENDLEALQEKRKDAISSFRRLKFRLQKRYKNISADNFLFPEHEQMEKKARYQDQVEYEDLIGYLRKKTEDRRLTSLDQSKDNKISKAIRIIKLSEGVIAEGTVNQKAE